MREEVQLTDPLGWGKAKKKFIWLSESVYGQIQGLVKQMSQTSKVKNHIPVWWPNLMRKARSIKSLGEHDDNPVF